jgi:hypothetical protein
MIRAHVCGVTKNRRSGGMLVDHVEIELPNTSYLKDWLTFSQGFAVSRGYDFMSAWTFWEHLEDAVMEVSFAYQRRHCIMTVGPGLGVAVLV